ncbi:hypothetical protein J6590_089672 [Homalodisca vitripennis]|nr:hypothetical protein J6590_089672 [Homalodisca vitripennis]
MKAGKRISGESSSRWRHKVAIPSRRFLSGIKGVEEALLTFLRGPLIEPILQCNSILPAAPLKSAVQRPTSKRFLRNERCFDYTSWLMWLLILNKETESRQNVVRNTRSTLLRLRRVAGLPPTVVIDVKHQLVPLHLEKVASPLPLDAILSTPDVVFIISVYIIINYLSDLNLDSAVLVCSTLNCERDRHAGVWCGGAPGAATSNKGVDSIEASCPTRLA